MPTLVYDTGVYGDPYGETATIILTPPEPVVLPPRGWTAVLCSALTGDPIGEMLNLYDRAVAFRLNRPTTFRCRARLDDPLADYLLEGNVLVKLYEGELLRFVGDVVTADETGAEQQKQIETLCSSPFWRLEGRLIGKSTAGYSQTTPIDRGAIAQALHAAAKAESPTGYRDFMYEASSSDTVGPWYYKPLAEVITELSAALDGFDWREVPIEPAGTPPAIADFEIKTFLGTPQPEAIFEYGDGRHNVREYRRAVSKQGLLNVGFSLPPGFPDTAQGAVQAGSDPASVASWGRHEGLVQSDLVVDALRLKLLQEHLLIRGAPRQVVQFTPVREDTIGGPPVPKFKEDYDVGDLVTFRAVVDGQPRIDGVFRVYGVDLAIDDEGAEQPTISVVPGD